MTTDASTDDAGARARERYRSIVETTGDGVVVFDTDGTILLVNETIVSFTGRARDDIVGEPLTFLTDSGLFDGAAYDRVAAAIAGLCDGEARERQLTVETIGPDSRVLNVRLSANVCDGAVAEVVGVFRDVTERERALETLERDRTALQRLYETGTTGDLTDEQRIRGVLDVGCEYLDLPYGFLTTVEGDTQQLVHVVGDHDLLEPGGTVALEQSYCRQTVESDGLVGLSDVPAELGTDDPAYATFGLSCYIGTKVLVGGTLYGTFCFAADDARDRAFSPSERQFVKLLGQWAGHTVERQQFETRLRGLNDVAAELLRADTVEAVARTAVDASADLFDLPVTACWTYDQQDERLRPLADTETCREVIGEPPTFERGRALVWESFDADELRVYEDLSTEERVYDPETPLRSEVHVPLGSHGVLIGGATEPRGFGDVDVESLRLLGGLAEAAMVSAKRREAVAERGEALQRQNEQLEEFARVVAHDLRNPLAGAVGFLEVARETHADAHFDRVAGSLDRMEALIDELLDIARGERQPTDVRDLPLGTVVREAWSYLDAPAATLRVADDLGRLDADETRLLQLFGNLFRNSVEHVGPDVTVEVGRLPDREGFYVANDGPPLPDRVRADVLQYGRAHSETGTGIGLMSVADVADAHGWELAVTDADIGGPRFEFRTGGGPSGA